MIFNCSIYRASLWLTAWLVLLFLPSIICAHPVATSAVLLDIRDSGIRLEVQLPVDQLKLALPKQAVPESGNIEGKTRALFVDYLGEFIRISPSKGAPLALEIDTMVISNVDGRPHLKAVLDFQRDSDGLDDSLQLHFNAILHRVVTHKAYVYIRNDFRHATFSHTPKQLGIIHYQNKSLDLDLTGGSLWSGSAAMFLHGMHHIAEGADHLLFLLCLLLPVPLLAQGGRWVGQAKTRDSVLMVVKTVTAFTVGHSLTLAVVSMDIIQFSSRWTEVFVAVSIVVAALHALVPVFGQRVILIALVFGLIHGMAFAETMQGLGLESGSTLLLALLGFNLGIEAMQLLIVVAVVPCLILLNQGRYYMVLRLGAAVLASFAALVWVYERFTGQSSGVGALINLLWSHSIWAYLALVLLTLVSKMLPSARVSTL